MAQLLQTTVNGNLYASNIIPNAHMSYALGNPDSMWATVFTPNIVSPYSAGVTISTYGDINLTTASTASINLSTENSSGYINMYGRRADLYGNAIRIYNPSANGYIELGRASNWWLLQGSGWTGLEVRDLEVNFRSTVQIADNKFIYGDADSVFHKMYAHNITFNFSNGSTYNSARYLRGACTLYSTDSTQYTASTFTQTLWNMSYSDSEHILFAAGRYSAAQTICGVYNAANASTTIRFLTCAGAYNANSNSQFQSISAQTSRVVLFYDKVQPLF